MNIQSGDINRLLGVIEDRINGYTPAQWMIHSFRNLKRITKKDDALISITKATYDNQQADKPAHLWPVLKQSILTTDSATRVGHIMSTRLFTAYVNDTATLTLKIMEWKDIHHLPVVDQQEKLVGLLTWTHISRFQDKIKDTKNAVPVSDIMIESVITVETCTPLTVAVSLMKKHNIGCLPVLQKEQLVGIITQKDIRKYNYE
jgi:CBS domain-containing protein